LRYGAAQRTFGLK